METYIKTLTSLAEKARSRAEDIARKENLPSDLAGMCARASAILFNLLQEAGIPAHIVFGRQHCFIELNDEMLIDITASQFGYDKIIIVSRDKLIYMLKDSDKKDFLANIGWWNDDGCSYNNIYDAMRHQSECSWPIEQKITNSDFI